MPDHAGHCAVAFARPERVIEKSAEPGPKLNASHPAKTGERISSSLLDVRESLSLHRGSKNFERLRDRLHSLAGHEVCYRFVMATNSDRPLGCIPEKARQIGLGLRDGIRRRHLFKYLHNLPPLTNRAADCGVITPEAVQDFPAGAEAL
jgi:hypothetical protein